jgi:hypothetical protein
VERGQNETVWVLAMGGIGELFGVSCWADTCLGDITGCVGKV